MKFNKKIGVLTLSVGLSSCSSNISENKSIPSQKNVQIVGAMKKVMMEGELDGLILLDSISNKENLYGIGPEEFLRSEILLLNGKAYQSKVVNDSTMIVEENLNVKAPFFVYSNVANWKELYPKKQIEDENDLEDFLIEETIQIDEPFTFKIEAEIDSAWIHIVNLPNGTKVNSPEEAHQGLVQYFIEKDKVILIGYFSKKHQRIFTHHDTFMHIHLINEAKNKMGHLENIYFKKAKYKIFIQG